MSRPLSIALAVYALSIAVAGYAAYASAAMNRTAEVPLATVVSVWREGERIARAVAKDKPESLLQSEADQPGSVRVYEEVLDEARLWSLQAPLFGAHFVVALDGLKATLGDRVAYLTPDDLLKRGAYGGKARWLGISIPQGMDRSKALKLLAEELNVDKDELLEHAEIRRVAFRRRVEHETASGELSPANLRRAVIAAGAYLARNVRDDGSYRYEIDPLSGEDTKGYNWPRHSGATWFLAQAAALAKDERLIEAVRRAAYHLVEHATFVCDRHECVGEGNEMNLGSASLALLAYTDLVRTQIAPELLPRARALAAFIRYLQRDDGEFMHVFDRSSQQPIDIQKPYFAGEAALALARYHRLAGDPRDLEASKRALAKLVDRPAAFVTTRYFWGSEHWTCQALEELWEAAPNQRALEFCLQWQESTRSGLMGEHPWPAYDGGYSPTIVGAPRFTGSASRMEAGVATLAVARRAGLPDGQVRELEQGIRRTLSFLLRHQFMPGPIELMPDPATVHGGFPGGVIDLKVRIDFPQHAGAALLRYLQLIEKR